jgi:hypothetical protein
LPRQHIALPRSDTDRSASRGERRTGNDHQHPSASELHVTVRTGCLSFL